MTEPRHTARGIVVHNGHILLIERWRDDLHYFSIPGGGVEAGETAEQAAVREIMEESSIDVRLQRLIIEMHDGDIIHQIFLCEYLSGEPHLPADSPEALLNDPNNRFAPKWLPLDEWATLPLKYWEPLREVIQKAVATGFADKVQIVSAG